jgi:hypothetical protein
LPEPVKRQDTDMTSVIERGAMDRLATRVVAGSSREWRCKEIAEVPD